MSFGSNGFIHSELKEAMRCSSSETTGQKTTTTCT